MIRMTVKFLMNRASTRMLEYYAEERIINSFDGDDLAFQCMIGFRKFTAYLNPFLPRNIIWRKAYNTIMVEGIRGTENKLVRLSLYFMIEDLEVLRKFHWTILGGRFNQLSHVSSPLLSKPGEY
ncbi:hypothetical protein Tco_1391569 [Tanacetum coccineum]